ncbi:MAG: heavy metal translocating P-type ATPase [Phycisphaerae bacterium]|nr:heavy metal translocating P-type ATPase [Phycisphaerae bacterium]
MTPDHATQDVELRIIGMTCGACVGRVERALRSIAAVRDVGVHLLTESARVTVDPAEFRRDSLIEAVRRVGYDAEFSGGPSALPAVGADERRRGESVRRVRQSMILAVGFALPILALDHVGHGLAATHAAGVFGGRLIQGSLMVLLFVSPAAGPLLVAGLRSAWFRTPNMDLLVTMGVGVAFASSVYATFAMDADFVHFHAAAVIIALVDIGRYLETRARGRTGAAVAALAQRMPRTANVRRDASIVTVPIESVAIGDEIVVATGQSIPTDGIVSTGRASVDERLWTGEPLPREKSPGNAVLAGTIVAEGAASIRVTRVGSQAAIGRILELVAESQRSGTQMQRMADRVAGIFVPIVIGIAAVTLAGWLLTGGTAALPAALRSTIAVLVVACPCALGLATPTVVAVVNGLAAARGILVRDAATLEAFGQVNVVLWDKTGTLTSGKLGVVRVRRVGDAAPTERELLRMAASAELLSVHPIGQAIVAHARREMTEPAEPETFESVAGGGVVARIDGHDVIVASAKFLAARGIETSSTSPMSDEAGEEGHSVCWIALDGRLVGAIELSDVLRPSAASAVARLSRAGIRSVLLTGDSARAAHAVARQVGIADVVAEASPEDKRQAVEMWRGRGAIVAAVGDGINDAPALAAASVGVAFATGADVALESAGVNLIGSTPHLVADAVELSRAARRVMRQNLAWAFGYNIAMIPAAAVGVLPPGIAAGAMMASSLTVVINALRLGGHASGRRESVGAKKPPEPSATAK